MAWECPTLEAHEMSRDFRLGGQQQTRETFEVTYPGKCTYSKPLKMYSKSLQRGD